MRSKKNTLFVMIGLVIGWAGITAVADVAAKPIFGLNQRAGADYSIGSSQKDGEFKYQLDLTTKAAAVKAVILSEFDDRDKDNPQPLGLLSPVKLTKAIELASMASGRLVFVDYDVQLPLDKLNWDCKGKVTNLDGSETIVFETVVDDSKANVVLKLAKTYTLEKDSYITDCKLTIENVSLEKHQIYLDMQGPIGISREAFRRDERKIVAGFSDPTGKIVSERWKIGSLNNKGSKNIAMENAQFLWAAIVNKYFAAIIVPVPSEGAKLCDWLKVKNANGYNPDRDPKANTGDETVGIRMQTSPTIISAGQKQTYNFKLYFGPKNKEVFDDNEYFSKMKFVETITFMPCFCCPAAIIRPMAFGILAAIEFLHSYVVPNYGIVIIILVLIIRVVLHPVTKKSQVSMSKMSKLAPEAAKLKEKYADNKAELNRQMMALYKGNGASPIMGMIPMLLQMPIWISLYSAISASISLRGSAFLPVWITDLSVPDALFTFPAVTLPIFGELNSFNLLPLLMGVAFFLQQKFMPQTAAANPQAEQQQKMMKIMMPILFPMMLYKAPSGLNLYIMTSVFAGVIEQHIIRKHIKEKEQTGNVGLVAATSKTGGKVKKKKPKPFYKNR